MFLHIHFVTKLKIIFHLYIPLLPLLFHLFYDLENSKIMSLMCCVNQSADVMFTHFSAGTRG